MSQVCDEVFLDVHKLLRMCIVLKALHTINACFSGKHASRTCRFNYLSCISKNRPFSETKCFRRISFCQSQFRNDIKYFVTDKRRQLCTSWICCFLRTASLEDQLSLVTLTLFSRSTAHWQCHNLSNFSLSVLYFLNQLVGSGQTFSGLYDKVGLIPEFYFNVVWDYKLFGLFLHKDIYTLIRLLCLNSWTSCHSYKRRD